MLLMLPVNVQAPQPATVRVTCRRRNTIDHLLAAERAVTLRSIGELFEDMSSSTYRITLTTDFQRFVTSRNVDPQAFADDFKISFAQAGHGQSLVAVGQADGQFQCRNTPPGLAGFIAAIILPA